MPASKKTVSKKSPIKKYSKKKVFLTNNRKRQLEIISALLTGTAIFLTYREYKKTYNQLTEDNKKIIDQYFWF